MIASATSSAHAVWYGNLHCLISYPWILMVLMLTSAVCGAIIGHERRARNKPVGTRTVTLICLGSTLFTVSSILIAGSSEADPGRIAAQVVTGVGFLGAGTILHTRGRVKGLTTAATIWVAAAMGVLIGAGYAVPGLALSLFVIVVLQLHERKNPTHRPPCPPGHPPAPPPEHP